MRLNQDKHTKDLTTLLALLRRTRMGAKSTAAN